jgi:hypothetical protein
MKIVRDKTPRWRVEGGAKALEGVMFLTVEEAEHEAKVFGAMQRLWDAGLDNTVPRSLYDVATLAVDVLGWQPKATALIEDKSTAPAKRARKAKQPA